jgi:hypothetical protein
MLYVNYIISTNQKLNKIHRLRITRKIYSLAHRRPHVRKQKAQQKNPSAGAGLLIK